jgi:hypothetical protein
MTRLPSQLVQFEKPPPAQYQRPEFYWRGGDILKEQETLAHEYKNALTDFRLAQHRLQALQNEVSECTTILQEQDGYTRSLAAFLERDTRSFERTVQLKEYLASLEADIANNIPVLAELRRMQRPAAIGTLQKELAGYLLQIQEDNKTIENCVEDQNEFKRQIAACTVHNRYREAVLLDHELERVGEKKQRLRALLGKTRIEFERLRALPLLVDPESSEERVRLRQNSDKNIEWLRARERVDSRPSKQRGKLENLLGQIRELNERMIDVGLEQEVVDVEEVRKRVLPAQEDGHKDIEWSDHELEAKPRPPPQPSQKPTPRRRVSRSTPKKTSPSPEIGKDRSPARVDPASVLVDEEEQQKSGLEGAAVSSEAKAEEETATEERQLSEEAVTGQEETTEEGEQSAQSAEEDADNKEEGAENAEEDAENAEEDAENGEEAAENAEEDSENAEPAENGEEDAEAAEEGGEEEKTTEEQADGHDEDGGENQHFESDPNGDFESDPDTKEAEGEAAEEENNEQTTAEESGQESAKNAAKHENEEEDDGFDDFARDLGE